VITSKINIMKTFLIIAIIGAFGLSGHAQVGQLDTSRLRIGCLCSGVRGWASITATVGGRATRITCGYQYSIKVNERVKFVGSYGCIGNCAAQYKFILKNLSEGTDTNSAGSTFRWLHTFTKAGYYALIVVPVCGNTTTCPECKFYFTVIP
jgi:hypothetical protein